MRLELGEDVFNRAHFGDGVNGLAFEGDGGKSLGARNCERVLRACGRPVRINAWGQANGQPAWLNRQFSCTHEFSPFPAWKFVLVARVSALPQNAELSRL